MTRIRETVLPNGLRVLTDPMDTVESVSMGVWVNVGTRHERPEINGVSHLLEHMAFKGTHRRSARDIAEQIEAVGGHLNAYTSREQTAYYAKVLKEDVALGLDIISDILQHSVIDPEELAREQAVVVQEISQAIDTPDDIIFDYFQETAYPDQALGRPVLGTEELVRGMNRDVVHGYMSQNYSASRMILAAAGRVDHDQIVEMAHKAFDTLPAEADLPEEPANYRGGDFREERDLEQVHVLLGFDSVAYDDPDFYAASVYSTVLGGGMSSRLFQEIREKRGLVYSIYSYASSYHDGGMFAVYAGTGENEVAELIPVACEEMLRSTEDVTEEEVRRARAQLKASMLMSLESTSSRCEQLARQIMAFGRPIPVEEVVAKIEAVDAAAVKRTARRILSSRPTVAAIGPLGKVESYDQIASRLAL
ncbi:pitrilysin family protein [Telmatospirillum sp. J64-1]|uniref:M16 family metallopeptidase n=1 Tax=Telmatospirillum sp. J64-1 TaxID=2502183 RepID=UPI00115CA8B7|nr:pitrilysin family protein [Telmatospirillum sp. J64-1]